MRERQVGLRTTTSSRPLLLLNISAIGRGDRCCLPEGTTKGTDHPRLYYLLRYIRRAGAGLSLPLSSSPSPSSPLHSWKAGQILLAFPLPASAVIPALTHPRALFIRRNLNYTFDRTLRRVHRRRRVSRSLNANVRCRDAKYLDRLYARRV